MGREIEREIKVARLEADLRRQIELGLNISISDTQWIWAVHFMGRDHEVWVNAWQKLDPILISDLASRLFLRESELSMAGDPSHWQSLDLDGVDAPEVGQTYVNKTLQVGSAPRLDSVVQRQPPFLGPENSTEGLTEVVALAQSLALIAGQDEDVLRYRKDHLPTGLVEPQSVHRTIVAMATEMRRFDFWLSDVPLPLDPFEATGTRTSSGGEVTYGAWIPVQFLLEQRRLHFVRYYVPYIISSGQGKRIVWGQSAMPTAHGSPLEELREVSIQVALRYGWQAAQASTFILTDATPGIEPITARHRRSRALGAVQRIDMSIDPSLSPKEVAEAYRRARADALGSRQRVRTLDQKHLHLALLTLQKGERTWVKLLEAWNERWHGEHPEWLYAQDWTFSRDGKAALEHLVGALDPAIVEQLRWLPTVLAPGGGASDAQAEEDQ